MDRDRFNIKTNMAAEGYDDRSALKIKIYTTGEGVLANERFPNYI